MRTIAVISDGYLLLADRLAIADGLVNKMTLTAIAAGIGKHASSVSRELKRRRHKQRSIAGHYLPYQAHGGAPAKRACPARWPR